MAHRNRVNFVSRSPFEPLRGYSRAVQVGDLILISGTTALGEDGQVVGVGSPYEQTKFVIARIRAILQKAGFDLANVVRTRLFVTQIANWDSYAQAHREAFESIRPASSMVQVARLVDSRLLIEMEVEAMRGWHETVVEQVVFDR